MRFSSATECSVTQWQAIVVKVTQVVEAAPSTEQLLAENRALRQALSKVQGVPPAEVQLHESPPTERQP